MKNIMFIYPSTLAAKSNWHRRNTSTRGYARYRSAVASGKTTKDYSAYRDNKSFLVEVCI